jgi:Spy/CpxP family protein refolding chaperone
MTDKTAVTGAPRRALRKLMAAVFAGSLVLGAGGTAFAKADRADPARFQERLEKRIDRAFKGTDVTDAQKKQVTDIVKAGFADLKGVREKASANHKAMQEAMQAPTIDKAKIETLRVEQMKIADESSKRLTKAMTDAGEVLNQTQRQAFFKNWDSRRHGKRHG